MVSGHIFDIQRFSIHDGPGIRTTVFLKGCPLHCIWCGNPESISREPSLSYISSKCIACDACYEACPESALSPRARGPSDESTSTHPVADIDRTRCTRCGHCASVCDPAALEIVGRVVSTDEVLEQVMRDQAYYDRSGGGMTLSGGEPLMQPEFATMLVREARERGLRTAIETSGYAMWGSIRPLIPLVDLWLFDVKETDRRLHEKFTGKPNPLILSNLKLIHDAGGKIVLRCPMIPQHNARRDHLDGIVALARSLPNIEGVELLPYYDLWRAKLDRFGLTSELPNSVKPPGHDTVKGWHDYLRSRGTRMVNSI